MNKYVVIGVIVIVVMLFFLFNAFLKNAAGGPDNKLLQKYYDELTTNPNSATAYMEIARDNITAYPKPYDVDKALKDISKAIELDSSLIEAYELRTMLYYYTLENSEKALNDINTILELQPDNQFALDLKKDIMSDAQ